MPPRTDEEGRQNVNEQGTVDDEPVIVRPGEGPSHVTPFGDTLTWLAGGAETGGGYSLHDRIAPPGSASIPHVHHQVSEAFYVIDGEIEFAIANRKLVGGPGTFALARVGERHAWRNTSGREARVLVIFSPPVDYGYFEELDRLTRSASEGRPDLASLAALAEQYGLT